MISMNCGYIHTKYFNLKLNKKIFPETSNQMMVVERVVFLEVKLKNFMETSTAIMLA